ncbi:mediator of RNA polymerase II transcription subunit 15 [Scaptodrosophila lebanonensis]|uniref:Mediator of RNA polymerase II transcription subunit 15 n=1 Tax=Drosophila lebanonensis TaxID=7225 RepID=A0A6J2TFX8_DROLE|nr:mediator of RNA polymerase II transcription subunit 15 [Scaptodrosophila lebanonensis]
MSPSARSFLSILGALLFLFGYVQCESHKVEQSRTPKLMQFLSDPKPQLNQNQNRFTNQGPRIRAYSRGDNVPPVRSAVSHGLPSALRPPPPPAGPQIMRRVHSGNSIFVGPPHLQQQQGYQYDPAKASRYAHAKDTPVLDIGKNQFYRPELNQHLNNVQYPSEQYIHNFKASPRFNGNVVLKDQRNQFNAENPPSYTPIQQYAIPVQAPQYASIPQYQRDGYSVVPSKQTLVHQSQTPQRDASYSVYEEADPNAVRESSYNPGLGHQQPAAIIPPLVSKEAQQYLHFMSTNEYFLPKRDPNYKQLDSDHDQVRYHQEIQQQQQQQQQLYQKHAPLQHQQQGASQLQNSPAHISDSSVSSSYNQPIKVSELFYQQDPAPRNSAVVRGSYQTSQNAFIVKSDGNKAVKHIVSTPLATQSTTTQSPPATSYSQVRHNGHKAQTPEPLRFEFTEQDAIGGSSSYTRSPSSQQYYYETIVSTPTPRPTLALSNPAPVITKPVSEIADDAEDSADVEQSAPASLTPLPTTPVTPPEPPTDPKDIEAYCEKICANVYDENDQIICGSDGYMYTGEAQLECYSSCLGIEVSIKSKGSCSTL